MMDTTLALGWAERAVEQNDQYLPSWRAFAAAAGHLGIESKGRAAVQRILAIAPGHTVSALRDTLKFSAPAKLEVYFDSLRRAGLPE
jgi:hypothetical protein